MSKYIEEVLTLVGEHYREKGVVEAWDLFNGTELTSPVDAVYQLKGKKQVLHIKAVHNPKKSERMGEDMILTSAAIKTPTRFQEDKMKDFKLMTRGEGILEVLLEDKNLGGGSEGIIRAIDRTIATDSNN